MSLTGTRKVVKRSWIDPNGYRQVLENALVERLGLANQRLPASNFRRRLVALGPSTPLSTHVTSAPSSRGKSEFEIELLAQPSSSTAVT